MIRQQHVVGSVIRRPLAFSVVQREVLVVLEAVSRILPIVLVAITRFSPMLWIIFILTVVVASDVVRPVAVVFVSVRLAILRLSVYCAPTRKNYSYRFSNTRNTYHPCNFSILWSALKSRVNRFRIATRQTHLSAAKIKHWTRLDEAIHICETKRRIWTRLG